LHPRQKTLEILSHVNKRVRGHAAISLPLPALVSLYGSASAAVMVRNFALVYVEMAFERAQPAERHAVVAQLLRNVSRAPAAHAPMLLRMAVAGLEALAESSAQPRSAEAALEAYPFLSDGLDRGVFLAFALDVMLYARPVVAAVAAPSGLAGAPPSAAAMAAAMAAAVAEPAEALPPPGLSLDAAATVAGKSAPDANALQRRKLALLNLSAAAELPPRACVLLYLAAAADGALPAVATRGEELLRKRIAYDSPKPGVDLEDESLLASVFDLFLGTETRSAASPALKARLLSLLCRSRCAANGGSRALAVLAAAVAPGGGVPARLRAAGMEFCVWTLKHARDDVLRPLAPQLLEALTACLDEGAASAAEGGADAGSCASLRGFAYAAWGQLAARLPQLVASDVDAADRLFAALASEPAGARASVAEAAGALCAAYAAAAPPGVRAQLLSRIPDWSRSPSDGTRAAAVRWARDLFPFDCAPARLACIVASGDSKLEVREEGLKGLHPTPVGPPPLIAGTAPVQPEATAAFPPLAAMLAELAGQHPELGRAGGADPLASPARPLLLPARSFAAAVAFLRDCRGADKARDATVPAAFPAPYRSFLEAALCRDAPAELWAAALAALLDAAADAPIEAAAAYASRAAVLRPMLAHSAPDVRELSAQLLAVAAAGMASPDAAALLASLSGVAAGGVGAPGGASGGNVRFEEADGATAAAGYILAQAAAGAPALPAGAAAAAAEALLKAACGSDDSLASAAAAALGHAGLRAPLPLPEGEAVADVPAADAVTPAAAVAAAVVVVPATRAGVATRVAALLRCRDPKHVARAACAAGHLAAGDPACGPLVAPLVEALLGVAAVKTPTTEAVTFAVGDAIAAAFAGLPPAAVDAELRRGGAAGARAAPSASAAEEDNDDDEDTGGDAMDTDSAADAAAAAATEAAATAAAAAEAPARAAAQVRILSALLGPLATSSRPTERCAAAVWLLALVAAGGGASAGGARCHPALAPRLAACQEAFGTLLGDASETTQDCASRGLSLVYRRGDAATRRALVGSLVATLSGDRAPAKRAVKLTDDTEVFAAGALGEAPASAGGGGLSTYKELCAMATDMGQPDLVFRFMDLANHARALSAKRGAAFGFVSIAKRAGAALAPHMGALVPKLYRMLHDPNKGVADAAQAIWQALVSDPRAAVDEHFDAIVRDLLKDLGGRLWRSREAAAAALADALQGRRWAALAPHFGECWTMALRALDDIKESVRIQASGLARTLAALTVRLTDASATADSADAAAALAVAMPLLLKQGVPAQAAEVRAIAVRTVSQIADKASAEALLPHLGDVVAVMLESLSSLEDSRLSYVTQHAQSVGINAEALDVARVAASRGGLLGDALDRCLRHVTTPEAVGDVVPRLAALARSGTGLNTRAGTARFAAALCAPGRIPGGIGAAHAASLLGAFLTALEAERAPAVRAAYAAAAAAAARHAAPARLATAIAAALKPVQGEGGEAEAAARGALLLRALSRDAPDTLAPFHSEVLPAAFLAKFEADAAGGPLWAEVWESNTGAASAALRLYAPEVAALCRDALAASAWPRKKAGALAAAALASGLAGAAGGDALAPLAPTLAAQLLAALPGRIWDGKEAVLQACGALAAAAPEALLATPHGAALLDAALAAAARRKPAYRAAALECLAAALGAFKARDCFEQVAPMLLPACAAPPPAPPPAVPAGETAPPEDEDAPPPPPPAPESLRCVAAAWAAASAATVAARGGDVAAALAAALALDRPWATRAAALEAAAAFAAKIVPPATSSAPAVAPGPPQAAAAEWYAVLLPAVCLNVTETKSAAVRTAAIELVGQLLAPAAPRVPAAVAAAATAAVAAAGESDANGGVRGAAARVSAALRDAPTPMAM
jgi:proteasome component ECM29